MLKRKHQHSSPVGVVQSTKRQRLQATVEDVSGSPNEVLSRPVDCVMTESILSDTGPSRIKFTNKNRDEGVASARKSSRRLYVTAKNNQKSPTRRRAAIMLSGNEDYFPAFQEHLDTLSDTESNALIARLSCSPTMSVVATVEIHSMSSSVATPDYCHQLVLRSQFERPASTPPRERSPYPQPRSVALTLVNHNNVGMEPSRPLPIMQFDLLQNGLSKLKYFLECHTYTTPAMGRSDLFESPGSKYWVRKCDDLIDILAYTGGKPSQLLDSCLLELTRSVSQQLKASPMATCVFMSTVFADFCTPGPNKQASEIIFQMISVSKDSDQHPFLQTVAHSIMFQEWQIGESMASYMRCMLDCFSNKLSSKNRYLLTFRLRLSTIHFAIGQQNSALATLVNVQTLCEALLDDGDVENAFDVLYGIGIVFYYDRTDFGTAKMYFERAWSIRGLQPGQEHTKADCAYVMALCCNKLDLLELAVEWAQKALNAALVLCDQGSAALYTFQTALDFHKARLREQQGRAAINWTGAHTGPQENYQSGTYYGQPQANDWPGPLVGAQQDWRSPSDGYGVHAFGCGWKQEKQNP